VEEHTKGNDNERIRTVIFPDEEARNKEEQDNGKAVEEDFAVVKARAEDDVPERLVDDIRKHAPECAEDNDGSGMEEFVQNKPDDEADDKMAKEEHVPVHSVLRHEKYMGVLRTELKYFFTVVIPIYWHIPGWTEKNRPGRE
jgi:hypothetical protein